jgi:hypothetical protein
MKVDHLLSDIIQMVKLLKKNTSMKMVLPQDTIKKMDLKSMRPLTAGENLPSRDTTQTPEKTPTNTKMTGATGSANPSIPPPEK